MMAPGDEVVALVNNLGGASNFELSILANACVRVLEGEDYRARVTRVLVGSYMTSFDMRGASLTILNVQDEPGLVELLDAPTSAPAWGRCDAWKSGGAARPSAAPVPEVAADDKAASDVPLPELAVPEFAPRARAMVSVAVAKLEASESLLTQYDTIVGDGDCGITFARGALEIKTRLASGALSVDHPVTLFSGLADAVSASMGGTSGVLLELMFRKMSSTLSRVESIGAAELCAAYTAGVDAVSLYGGASVGARTMLDALVPSATALAATRSIQHAALQARQGADSTAQMKVASAGRSNYLSEETLQGTPDPGAVAVAAVFESFVAL
jgi:dihydroxyacetone kinase